MGAAVGLGWLNKRPQGLNAGVVVPAPSAAVSGPAMPDVTCARIASVVSAAVSFALASTEVSLRAVSARAVSPGTAVVPAGAGGGLMRRRALGPQ